MKNVRAAIRMEVPDWQIGQPVTVYFKDTMCKRGICELDIGDIDEKHMKDLIEWTDDAMALIKRQENIIKQYRRADGFLAAHGWKWEDTEDRV